MRLIDADMLDKSLTALRFTADGKLAHWGDRKDWCLHGSEIETLIANAPTIDAEPIRHGEWILVEAETGIEAFGFKEIRVVGYTCSICGASIGAPEKCFCYCPNCGAKMDKVKG